MKEKESIISIIKEFLFIKFIFPIITEIKKRKKRGYLLISKKTELELKEYFEYLVLFAFIALLFLITFKVLRK
ncbi:MAG TPA: hypothetical protein PLD27_08150 [bacterium]|nr:hypothetical protein [bacterium]HPQ19176.1 hypothetical protein [bacterium]